MNENSDEITREMFFPYTKIRKIQDEFMSSVAECIKSRKNLIVHAPTGLGKTAAVLAPAIYYAMKEKKTVFFLTSRHTQHMVAVNTLKSIRKKHNIEIKMADIIGKKWMCPIDGVQDLYSNEFNEFCKSLREEGKCEFYANVRSKNALSVDATITAEKIKNEMPLHCEDIIDISRKAKLCPYEMSLIVAGNATIIIGDYNYIFNPDISHNFFTKIKKDIEDSIVIIDEGHNIPKRMTDMMTKKLSTFVLKNAEREAERFKFGEIAEYIKRITGVFGELSSNIDLFRMTERIIEKDEFISKVNEIFEYDKLIEIFNNVADIIREKQRQSYIGSVANFLECWKGTDFAFVRIISKRESKHGAIITLHYKCLDPSIATKNIVNNTHSTIIMSGTLVPTTMYRDLLGFDANKTIEKEFNSSFPKKNRRVMIVPDTTTRFSQRNESQYLKIAEICSSIVNNIPGNSAIFFPSYALRDNVNKYFSGFCRRTTFLEMPNLSKEQKGELLDRFKSYKQTGAVLLGVASANFSEGIDITDNILKCVIVAGLPLQKPDVETQKLIEYYDEKFGKGKGVDYGYIFPAITKCLQSAGRCIRSETDRGIIIFLDERFAWRNYLKCFPVDMDIRITSDYLSEIKEFFGLTEN